MGNNGSTKQEQKKFKAFLITRGALIWLEEGIDGSPNIKPQLQNEPGGIQADA